jgi:hypothetical protein
MQAAQPMHSFCSPLRMSMPVGQTCTHRVQSMQSPSPCALGVGLLRARAARVTAFGVVGDDEGVLVDQGALEARVGAHVLAHLLAQEARIAVGGGAVEQHPEPFQGRHVQGHRRGGQFPDRREVADEAEAGDQRDGQPGPLLGALAQDLVRAPGRLVQLHARDAVAFDLAFGPHEDLGVDRLRAGVAAPQPAGHGSEEEQASADSTSSAARKIRSCG